MDIVGLPHSLGARAAANLTFVSLAAGIVLLATRPPGRALFRLVILGALVAVAALTASGSQFIAR